jgi:hypothetical protein
VDDVRTMEQLHQLLVRMTGAILPKGL